MKLEYTPELAKELERLVAEVNAPGASQAAIGLIGTDEDKRGCLIVVNGWGAAYEIGHLVKRAGFWDPRAALEREGQGG